MVPYFVFENVMHRVKVQGIVGGLLNLSSASVWDVTAKTGVNTDVTTGANIDNKASETGGWTGGRSAPLAPNKPGCPEPLSPAFQRSSENAFEAHSSDQLIAYDSPHCARFDFAAKRRDLGPPSSPVRRGPKSLQRDHSLTSAEEREITLLNSLEADVMRRAKGIPYNLSLVRRIWISVRERLAARKVHLPELGLAVYMLGILAYCVGTGQSGFYFHLGTQGLGYLIAGLGLLG